jgi:outer membrane receptor protein involved in Fe transport
MLIGMRGKREYGRALGPFLVLAALVLGPAFMCALPAFALPVPTMPSALPSAFPAAPKLPSAMPAPPALPSGMPQAPKLPTFPSSMPVAPIPSVAPVTAVEGSPEDSEEKFDKDESKEPTEGPELPRALRRSMKDGSLQVQESTPSTGQLSIEDIVNPNMSGSSKRGEGLLSAPVWAITISGREIIDRGYTNLTEILDDIPGVDVARAWGQDYAKSYWRGYRPGTGADPYLLTLDGEPLNSLYFGDTSIMAAMPLTNIDHVEVIYGPASVANGGEATAGIINIVTKDGAQRQERKEYGTTLTSRLTYGGPQAVLSSVQDSHTLGDASLLWTTHDFRFRVSGYFDSSSLDPKMGENYEWTKSKYYADRRLWGSSADTTGYPGSFGAYESKHGVDARLNFGTTEVSAQLFSMTTGLGERAPADVWQISTPLTISELALGVTHAIQLTGKIRTTSRVRYRRSAVDLSAKLATLFSKDGVPTGVVEKETSIPNSSLRVVQELNVDVGRKLFTNTDELDVDLGISLEHREINTAIRPELNMLYPITGAAQNLNLQTDPTLGARTFDSSERDAVYALARYRVNPTNVAHLGARVERDTLSDSTSVVTRLGYVGSFDPFTAKLLFAQSGYRPTADDVFRARAAGAPPLSESHATNVEANLSLKLSQVALTASAWKVHYADPIVEDPKVEGGRARRSIDGRDAAGVDAAARFVAQPFQVWAYYSRYLQKTETIDSTSAPMPIGDLADNKVWAGATVEQPFFTATVFGRWVGERQTVATNPIPSIPAFFTLDANVVIRNVGIEGLSLGLRGTNLLNAQTFAPGLSTASAGNTPGTFTTGGVWQGSSGLFNSLMPQPGRSLYATVRLEY